MIPVKAYPADLIQQAVNGDKEALEALIKQIQDRIYGLAIRMLWHPADAEDATQEILVRIVTHLGSFRGESSFSTWCYRIATNHLLTTNKRRAERMEMTFEKCEEEIQSGIAYSWSHSTPEAEQRLMVEELMIGCAQGMLLCLDRDLRISYILGEVLELSSQQGGEILHITPVAFRKRLSRARSLLRDFLNKHCGLIEPSSSCKCDRQIPYAIKTGLVNPQKLLFADHPRRDQRGSSIEQVLNEVSELEPVAGFFHSLPDYAAPNTFVENVRRIVGLHKSNNPSLSHR
ncbi:MAG: RNA polymerase sigma factor [Desulfomonile tiedjei]|uniref:RNA polymerase sigma factor n=1 Tax=Desulfomonile tiedjei TaxID=2358 RepID=A0A9D6V363_9BACT|nr:RNA polymerase sigma factor [Desulfomonile tiedjei]